MHPYHVIHPASPNFINGDNETARPVHADGRVSDTITITSGPVVFLAHCANDNIAI
jgi:hypothetical protein